MDDGVARPSEPGRDNYHFFDGFAFGLKDVAAVRTYQIGGEE